MKKIVLSALTVAALGTVAASAGTVYKDRNGVLYTSAGEGRVAIEVKEVKKSTAVAKTGPLSRLHFKGDLRLRYESKETEYRDGTTATDDQEYHNRYRLRLNSWINLTDNLTFEASMRSGYGNPTSGNQSFDNDKDTDAGGLSDYWWQSLRFNVMNLKYKDGAHTVKAGRHPYMIYRPLKSQLIWDNDISFNGLSYGYKDDSKIMNFSISQPTFAERVNAKDDVNLFVAQYVHKTKLDGAKLNLGAGAYIYDGIKGNTAFYYPERTGKKMGNTFVTNTLGQDVYKNDFHILEAFAELKMKDVYGLPVALAAGVAHNAAASKDNTGYDLAIKVGSAKKVGDLQVKYSYTYSPEDAVLGDHSDSDNFGGGTAADGHAIRTKYKFGKNTYLAGTFFYNSLHETKKSGGAADYERVQLDAIIKF
ncbi:putative porin [Sulfurimonas sp.]|nr:putative porin [Sulfurimonas sp.]